ncbi:MAG: hypothetical protein HKP61_21405, partial [Dactylosporangium sp.]|nr:hypothetical protein [Dactylosporangium sp.]NNJ63440.1 hypothetical protein [Dactylosporangium sp.]
MRILLAGPDHARGSLPPYLNVLASELRRAGAHVDRLGSTTTAYDTGRGRFHDRDWVTAAADDLATLADPTRYDVVSLHFGNLEIEQLLPERWRRHAITLPPVAVHVHALSPTLFTRHIPAPDLRAAVDAGISAAAGLVYFGHYARTALTGGLPATAGIPALVAPLPTTIPAGIIPTASPALDDAHPDSILLSLYGYAAPWKSAPDLLAALDATAAPVRVVLAGPFWDDPDQAGVDL